MSVETIKSTFISNRDATPTVATAASIAGGNIRSAEGFVTVSASSSATSYYPMCSIPSNSRVEAVSIQFAALGTSCASNVGVYVPTQTNPALLALSSAYVGGAAISAAFFASALATAAATGPTNIVNSSGTNTIALQEQELWQAIGLASDPGCNLDIGVAITTAAVAGGLMGLKVTYVQ